MSMSIKRTKSIDLDNPSSSELQKPNNIAVKTKVVSTEENKENKFRLFDEERKRANRNKKKTDKDKKNATK